jgi:hypothetical protein
VAGTRRRTTAERDEEHARFEELFARAQTAGRHAAARAAPEHWRDEHGHENAVVGFAWVVVRPGTTGFGRWLLRTGRGHPNHPGTGVKIGVGSGVALAPKEVHAVAFAAVLQRAGVDAEADSRED